MLKSLDIWYDLNVLATKLDCMNAGVETSMVQFDDPIVIRDVDLQFRHLVKEFLAVAKKNPADALERIKKAAVVYEDEEVERLWEEIAELEDRERHYLVNKLKNELAQTESVDLEQMGADILA